MKGFVVMMCLLATGGCWAQEEKHLQGTLVNEEKSENEIIELAQKRNVMEMEVSVYPNPSEGILYIEGHEGTSVTIYSAEGTYVGTWVVGEGQKVEITDLPQGTFICTITEGTKRTIKKILVI
jgi:hypothetical protein